MSLLDNWEVEKIIHKGNMREFNFLNEHKFIEEIEDGYYYMCASFTAVEKEFYDRRNKELAKELGIDNVDLEIKKFIKKLNRYNEIKDIAQSLMGKIADMRGVSIKDIHEELDVLIEN